MRVGDGWRVPDFPHEPVGTPSVTTVRNALLTPVKRGPLRTVVAPTRWLRGAVHDEEGRLIESSQKIGGLGGNDLVMADPRRAAAPAGARRLSGRWLYGGHWINHFGHFFTESVTTLWPSETAIDGLVFHAYSNAHRAVAPWQQEIVELAGWGDLAIEVVNRSAVRVDELVVPSRAVVVNGWGHDEACAVWQRIADSARGSLPRVDTRGGSPLTYLSRTSHNRELRATNQDTRTTAVQDIELDRIFAGSGFDVVTPEHLPFRDQVRTAAAASVIAGLAGTALHLSAFAPPGVRVIELGDSRSPDVQVPQQLVIDCLRQHPSMFVPADIPPAHLADLLRTALTEPGS